MSHARDDIAVFALGAMETDELLELADHIDGCGSCRELLDINWEAMAETSGTMRPAPPRVWQSILGEIVPS